MRADRLIALLLMMQSRGRVTAADVADELEISERTARRDLEALSMAGLPVYSQPGRGGGWQLLGGASTDLTGLSRDEAHALFLAAGPGVESTPALRSALRKLTGALPEPFRTGATTASAAIKVDTAGWVGAELTQSPDALGPLTEAVVEGHQVRLDYDSARNEKGVRVVHPLGLVNKRNVWYLVGTNDGEVRTYRVDRVRSAERIDAPVDTPDGFDLDSEWRAIVERVEDLRIRVRATALVEAWAMGPLRWFFGIHVRVTETRPDGRLLVEIGAQSPKAMAGQIAGLGAAVELVDAPSEVLDEMRRIATELAGRYC